MQTTFLILIATATVVTTVINFAKPIFKETKYAETICILLSFVLWVVGAFSVRPYLEIELTTGAVFLIWLAIGTGANVFYDIWKLVTNAGKTDLPKIK